MFHSIVSVTNTLPHELKLWFEPWAESVSISSDESVLVEIETPTKCAVEIAQNPDGMVFFGPPRSNLKVINSEGATIWESWEPAPAIPE